MSEKKHIRNRNKKSQFHFIYNTQMDMYKFIRKTEAEQKSIIQGLLLASDRFKTNFKDYVTCDAPKDKRNLEISKFRIGLEFGSKGGVVDETEKRKRHLLHIDAYVGFNGFCKLRYDVITKLYNDYLAPFGIKGFFRNSYVKDSAQDAYDYTGKEGIQLMA